MATLFELYDGESGRWPGTGWWNAANALETTIDYTSRSGSTAYAGAIRNTFARCGSARFLNDFYDDEGWWALAWLKAYDLTHDPGFLGASRAIFADMCRGWDRTCGGGIWWNKAHAKKNAIANELFLKVAALLHLRTPGDAGPGSCLEWAERCWTWFANSGMINARGLVNDGLTADCRNDGGTTWTYNQGVALGGLVALSRATGDATLLSRARQIADASIATLSDRDGVLHEPGEPNMGADGPQFKGIFMRNLFELYEATTAPAYREFIVRNANAIWAKARDARCHLGGRWTGPLDAIDASRQSAALDALNAAIAFDVPSATYQAEAGILHGLWSGNAYGGFHGDGYITGWDRDGQSLDVLVDAASAGRYDVMLRYAAVSDASRTVAVNGTVFAVNETFPKTGNWDRWSAITLYDVPMRSGRNAISVAFDASKGNAGSLNLDEVTLL